MEFCSLDDPLCCKPIDIKRVEVSLELSELDLKDIIFDGSLHPDDCVKAFDIYNQKFPYNCLELLQQITAMYSFSSSSILEKMIINICTNRDIKVALIKKFDCFKTIYSGCSDRKKLVEFSKSIITHGEGWGGGMEGGVVMLVDNLRYLHSLYTLLGVEDNTLFSGFFNDTTVDCEYRYRELISLFTRNIYINDCNEDFGSYSYDYNISDDLKNEKSKTKLDESYSHFILDNCIKEFINFDRNVDTFRLLALQYLVGSGGEGRLREWAQNKLVEMCQNNDFEYNKRADCVDIILSLGDEKYKKIGRRVILELGDIDRELGDRSFYSFKQNVHLVEMCTEKEFYKLRELYNECGGRKTFKEIQTDFINAGGEDGDHEQEEIMVSLQRIRNDNFCYKGNRMTDIFSMVWNVIEYDKSQMEELKKRFREELVEMSNTCTSGHITRLVNVLSGFNFTSPTGELVEFLVGINWSDQIYNYLQTIFFKKIKQIDDEEIRGDILVELDGDTPFSERMNLYQFYIKNVDDMMSSIRGEFVETGHLEDREFDEYMAMAIIKLTT